MSTTDGSPQVLDAHSSVRPLSAPPSPSEAHWGEIRKHEENKGLERRREERRGTGVAQGPVLFFFFFCYKQTQQQRLFKLGWWKTLGRRTGTAGKNKTKNKHQMRLREHSLAGLVRVCLCVCALFERTSLQCLYCRVQSAARTCVSCSLRCLPARSAK